MSEVKKEKADKSLSEAAPVKKKKKMKSFLFRVTRDLSVIGAFIAAFIVFCNVATYYGSENYIYENADKIPYNEYCVLLGTSKTLNGRENIYFTDRMDAAALLYHKGKVKYIIVSGAVHQNTAYDGPEDMTRALLARRIPADRIIKDNCGYRTLDSMYRACDVFGVKKFTVVSQYFHIARAIYVARHLDLDVIGFAADHGKVRFFSLRDRLREYMAKVKMMLDLYLLNTKPRVPIKKHPAPAAG
ncbi:MAG: ElyC/SanA/YdcF family protein [Victivallaceae bacterium]|nr:ElyC/SanA/YdcF family protein [Victivallaceae bacterium]